MGRYPVGLESDCTGLDCKPVISSLFSGFSFYFDGYLGEKTRLELVELVRTHGGSVEHFFSDSRVNVVIAKNLSYNTGQRFINVSYLNLSNSYVSEDNHSCDRSSVDFRLGRAEQTAVFHPIHNPA